MAVAELWQEMKDTIAFRASQSGSRSSSEGNRGSALVIVLLAVLLITSLVGWYVSREPDLLWVNWEIDGKPAPAGYATADTAIKIAETLLNKPGGFISNDKMPPFIILDNMPNWEYGALIQLRDAVKALRNDYSRSQSQSVENINLSRAEPAFNSDHMWWILPSCESKYQDGINFLKGYRDALIDPESADAQFYARADNLREWLSIIEKRLGSLSQRLSASVGQSRVNTDLAGDSSAENSTERPADIEVKTPWLEIDDVMYEARGSAWVLIHLLRAAEKDFNQVLGDKNASVSLRQIIRELESAVQPLNSPVVLNGSGFGMFANHSLVTASYISRANSAVINLRELLDQG
ncbi:MAG: DUF2333 family protein [Pseudomonadales bacterium]